MLSVETHAANPLNKSLMHLLHRSGQIATEIFAHAAGDAGLTPRQYAVLLTVQRNEGLSQTDLVHHTGIDRSTLADIVRRLLKKGLLQRRRTRHDQRAYSIRLTDAGHEFLRVCGPKAVEAEKQLMDALPDQLRDCFVSGLEQLVFTLEDK